MWTSAWEVVADFPAMVVHETWDSKSRRSKGAAEGQLSHLHTLAMETTGNAYLGAERDLSSAGPSGAPATHPPFPSLCHRVPIIQMHSSPSHYCAPVHVDPWVSSGSPRYTPASPRLYGAWGLHLSHVSGSFTSTDGWSLSSRSSVFMGMFSDSETHTYRRSSWIGELLFSVAAERE